MRRGTSVIVALLIGTPAAMSVSAPASAQDTARLIAECDRLAASDQDPARPASVPGIPLGQINTGAALPACLAAAKAAPREPRMIYELGRALDANKRYDQAKTAYQLAASMGYRPAASSLQALATTAASAPQAVETWLVQETPPWTGTWSLTKRADGVYAGRGQVRAGPSGATVSYDLDVIERNGSVAAVRRNSSDGNNCNFAGAGSGGRISGQYFCGSGGPYPWSAVTSAQSGAAARPVPASGGK